MNIKAGKLSVVLLLIFSFSISLLFTGCVANFKKDSKNETKKETTQTVYCNNCGEPANEVTKYCPKCGEEAKWVSDKPSTDETSKNKTQNKEESKEQNKNEVKNNYDTSKSNPKQNSQINYKAKYLSKLSQLEDIYENPDNAYEWSSTGDAAQAEYERYQAWDDMLNEIYALLKTQLSSSEMKALKNEEINWINYRDKTAENDARDFEGGSNYSVVYNGSLATTTKDRCYELVNNYMK